MLPSLSDQHDVTFRLCYRLYARGEVHQDSEPYEVGDVVTANFSNAAGTKSFKGRVVERTLRYWLVEALEPAWGDDVGRIFRIHSSIAPGFSSTNSIAPDARPRNVAGNSYAYGEEGERTVVPVDPTTADLFVLGQTRYESLDAARRDAHLIDVLGHDVVVAMTSE